MSERKVARLGFRCTEGEYARLREAAEGRGESISSLVTDVFDCGREGYDAVNWAVVRNWQGTYAVRGTMLNDVAHDLNSIALMVSGGVSGGTARAVGMDITTGLFGVSQHDAVLGSMLAPLRLALAPAHGRLRPDASGAGAGKPRNRFVSVRVPVRTADAVRLEAEELGTTLTEAVLARCVYTDRMPVVVDRPLLESVLYERARQLGNMRQIADALARIGEAVAETGAESPLDDTVPDAAERARTSTLRWADTVAETVGLALVASKLVRDL